MIAASYSLITEGVFFDQDATGQSIPSSSVFFLPILFIFLKFVINVKITLFIFTTFVVTLH